MACLKHPLIIGNVVELYPDSIASVLIEQALRSIKGSGQKPSSPTGTQPESVSAQEKELGDDKFGKSD